MFIDQIRRDSTKSQKKDVMRVKSERAKKYTDKKDADTGKTQTQNSQVLKGSKNTAHSQSSSKQSKQTKQAKQTKQTKQPQKSRQFNQSNQSNHAKQVNKMKNSNQTHSTTEPLSKKEKGFKVTAPDVTRTIQSLLSKNQSYKRMQNDSSAQSVVQKKKGKKNGTKQSYAKSGQKQGTHFQRGGAQKPYALLPQKTQQKSGIVSVLPKLKAETLRIIPLGGQEEVGRNMAVFEYGNDIVIIDMGVQWPEEDMPGIDYIVPNISYLQGKESRIRGVIFTHGHLDHIGAAPILLEQLGYPPIVGRDLTIEMIKNKMEDYRPGSVDRLRTIRVKSFRDTVRLGSFEAGFFDVEHSIMDAIGVVLATKAGTVLHLGDWMIGHDPVDPREISYRHLSRLPKPTILMLESLGAVNKKEPKSEKQIQENLESLISEAPGRVIIGTFASQIKRVSYLLEYAQKIGKKVALDGYSMKTNIEIAKSLGYVKVHKETLIPIQEINRHPENKVIVLCTGAQGETNAVLNRIVTDNHRFITLKKTDTVVFSSSIIPGNERSIQRLKDNLYRKCDNVIHSDIMDIHMSGHSTATDIQEILRQVKPTYFLPVYANHYFLKEAAFRAQEIGFPEKDIHVLDNGGVLEVYRGQATHLKQKVDSSYVFIDGLGVGDIGQVVLRDRQLLASDGMFAINVIVDGRTKEVAGNVQVTSRGFIYVKENFDLVNETKRRVVQIIRENTSAETKIDWKVVENSIREEIGQFLFQKTQRRPMVLPVLIEV